MRSSRRRSRGPGHLTLPVASHSRPPTVALPEPLWTESPNRLPYRLPPQPKGGENPWRGVLSLFGLGGGTAPGRLVSWLCVGLATVCCVLRVAPCTPVSVAQYRTIECLQRECLVGWVTGIFKHRVRSSDGQEGGPSAAGMETNLLLCASSGLSHVAVAVAGSGVVARRSRPC